MDDLIEFTSGAERERILARKNRLGVYKNQDSAERERVLKDRWQKKMERAIQSRV